MTASIGIATNRGDAASRLELVRRADALRIPAVWLTQAGLGADTLSVLAAAATQTERVLLGTAIVPIWPYHPLAIAQQAVTVASFAPGRLRLGLGTGGPGITAIYGIPYDRPLGHLREYVTVLKTLFAQGQIDFDGRYYRAHGRLGTREFPISKLDVPVLASALQRGSFVFCGEVADGALTWVCPVDYLRQVALPAMREGAEKAGRTPPPLIVHVPVALDTDMARVRAAVQSQLGVYPRLPHYQDMFTKAGFSEVAEKKWSDRMIDAVVAHGEPGVVRQRLGEILRDGIAQIMVHPITTGEDDAASLERILEFVASMQR